MTQRAERLQDRFFGSAEHPYRTFEREVDRHLRSEHTLLDAGCGRTAPVLAKYSGRARRLIGVDLVHFAPAVPGLELLNTDLQAVPLPDETVDLVMSRSVMEHVVDPESVYREIHRLLRPDGHFVFLTGNMWDYAALIARLVPNRFHGRIVSLTEGRAEEDVFPVAYRTNTRSRVEKWAKLTGFEIVSFRYLGQYPSYFMFNAFLFLLATGYEKLITRVEALRFLRGWILVTLRKHRSAPFSPAFRQPALPDVA